MKKRKISIATCPKSPFLFIKMLLIFVNLIDTFDTVRAMKATEPRTYFRTVYLLLLFEDTLSTFLYV